MIQFSAASFTATNFLNLQELKQDLADLVNYEPKENAIIASFKAKTMAGIEQVMNCFIEHDGDYFQILSIVEAKEQEVDISSLQFELNKQQKVMN